MKEKVTHQCIGTQLTFTTEVESYAAQDLVSGYYQYLDGEEAEIEVGDLEATMRKCTGGCPEDQRTEAPSDDKEDKFLFFMVVGIMVIVLLILALLVVLVIYKRR